ncbi:hypothetical protein RP20_CCG027224 [Aedes albopictus]|nr:hypothetical protein RP20_CCG027224 [Aedes albopictus]
MRPSDDQRTLFSNNGLARDRIWKDGFSGPAIFRKELQVALRGVSLGHSPTGTVEIHVRNPEWRTVSSHRTKLDCGPASFGSSVVVSIYPRVACYSSTFCYRMMLAFDGRFARWMTHARKRNGRRPDAKTTGAPKEELLSFAFPFISPPLVAVRSITTFSSCFCPDDVSADCQFSQIRRED